MWDWLETAAGALIIGLVALLLGWCLVYPMWLFFSGWRDFRLPKRWTFSIGSLLATTAAVAVAIWLFQAAGDGTTLDGRQPGIWLVAVAPGLLLLVYPLLVYYLVSQAMSARDKGVTERFLRPERIEIGTPDADKLNNPQRSGRKRRWWRRRWPSRFILPGSGQMPESKSHERE